MAEIIIRVQATRAAIYKAVARIPRVARAGGDVANRMMLNAGMALLGHVKQAFLVKSRGGTDEAGERWAPLKPKTVAYRHSRTRKEAKRAARPSQALNARQRSWWWSLYRRGLAMYRGDKARAARRAWLILKSDGAITLFDKYRNGSRAILQDTGLLLASLSPEVQSDNRVVRITPGMIVVGTNRKGAAAHHSGVLRRLPQRRLWPPPARWSPTWWRDVLKQVQNGLVGVAVQLIKEADK